MTEITVIKSEEDIPLSKEEREILFREISDQTGIPFSSLELMGKLEDEFIAQEIQSTKSNILSLTLRGLLKYPCVIPIGKIYKREMQSVKSLQDFYNIPEHKFGSAEKKKSNKRIKKPSKKTPKKSKVLEILEKDEKIRLSNIEPGEIIRDSEETSIAEIASTILISEQTIRSGKYKKDIISAFSFLYSADENNSQRIMYLPDILDKSIDYYKIANGETIDICGITIDPHLYLKPYYVDDIAGNMNLIGRIRSGYYNEEYLHIKLFSLFDVFFRKFYENNLLTIMGTQSGFIKRKGIYYILFKDEKHAKIIIDLLFGFFWYFSNRVQADYISLFLEIVHAKKTIQDSSSLCKFLTEKISYSEYKSQDNVKNIEKPVNLKGDKIMKKYLEKFRPWISVALLNTSSLIFDMSAAGLLTEWLILKYLILSDAPISNPRFKLYEEKLEESVQKLSDKVKQEAQGIKQDKELYKNAYLELVYRWIYIKKFGYFKYEEIMGKERKSTILNILYRENKKILDSVSKREKELVLIEKEKDDKFFQNMQNNRAPWVSLSQKLRYAKTLEERKKYYYELKKYLPSRHAESRKDWIRSKEGFPIICPHVRDQIEMELKGMTDKEIHEFLLKYAGESPLHDAYYCGICGEPMTYTDEMEGLTTFEGDQPIMMYRDSEDGMKEFIWKHTGQIVRGNIEFRDIRTNKYINQFISVIANDLHDVVVLIDKKIRRAKTNSLNEIDGKRKLYTAIYVWAILIKIVLENTGKVKFVFQKDFQKIPSDVLFKKVLEKILSTQDILLRELKDTNESHMRESLYAAYTNLSALLTKSKIETPKPLDEGEIISLDPIYLYMAWVYIVEQKNSSARNMLEEWESLTPSIVLGKTLNYDKPTLENIKPRNTVFSQYYSACYNNFVEYIQSQIYLIPVFNVSIIKDTPDTSTIIHVSINESHKKFTEHIAPTYDLQKQFFKEKDKEKDYPIGKLPFQKNRQYSIIKYVSGYPDYLLSRIYGKKINKDLDSKFLPSSIEKKDVKNDIFHHHKWNITIYCTLSKYKGFGLKKYKSSDIKSYDIDNISIMKDLTTSEGFSELKVVDHLCSICYNTLSSVSVFTGSDKDSIKESEYIKTILSEEQLLTSFFNYYQSRCPAPSKKQIKEGDSLHIFINIGDKKEECENCGATKEILFKKDNAYFQKYRGTFEGEQKEKHIFFTNTFSQSPNMVIDIPKSTKEWKYNPNIINEIVSKTYDLTSARLKKTAYHNIWQNMGITENSDYDQIMNGVDNPSASLSGDKILIGMRINRIDIYIKELMFDYYGLINYKNVSVPSVNIKNIVDSVGVEIASKLSKLPILPGEGYFSDLQRMKFLYFQQGDEIHISEFELEYLIQTLLFVYSSMINNAGKKLGNEFMLYFLDKLIKMEKTSSKLKDQKTAAVEASQKTNDENELNTQDHTQSRAFDGLITADQVDNYSYENIDYGGENEDINQ
jgi:hypothetical protein